MHNNMHNQRTRLAPDEAGKVDAWQPESAANKQSKIPIFSPLPPLHFPPLSPPLLLSSSPCFFSVWRSRAELPLIITHRHNT